MTPALLVLLSFLIAGQAWGQALESRVEQAAKLDIRRAPAEFTNRLRAIEKEVAERGGFAVAGQVRDEKGFFPIPGQFTVALKDNDSNAEDTYKFRDGWFISRSMRKEQLGYNTLVVASFFHRQAEQPLTIEAGRVTWANVTLRRASAAYQTSISGTVRDEEGRPVADADVRLTIDRSNGYFDTQATRSAKTNRQGRYSFTGLSFQPYSIHVSKTGYAFTFASFKPAEPGTAASSSEGDTSTPRPSRPSNILTMRTMWAKGGERTSDSRHADFVLAYPRAITIDYEYQSENQFTGQNVKRGVVWDVSRGIKFSEDSFSGYPHDLQLISKEGELFFRHAYVRGKGHGHYDLGEVPFDSVTEIDESEAIVRRDTPCVVNHVYCVWTYDGKYAKFIVRSIDVIRPD